MAGGVVDGQAVSQAVTNAAFIAKNGDDTTPSNLGLASTNPLYGSSVTSTQRELNAQASVIGMALNQVYNFATTWTSNLIGSAGDSIVARINAIMAKILSTATPSSIVYRDASANTAVNNINEAFITTVSSATPATMTVASQPLQQFTGSTNQILNLPAATTLANGYQAWVYNRSSATVTVKDGAAGTVQVMAAGTQCGFTCAANLTAAGTWDVSYTASGVTAITALTGDVAASGPGSAVATIQANAVTNAKAAQMATLTLKGNNTGATANSIDLTVAQVNTLLGTTSPLTTKGDIYGFSTVNARLPVGADGAQLVADSTQATGLKWGAAASSGGGSKNYISLGNFENNLTTGWSLGTVGTLTNALPTGTPTFGAGAAGALSIATIASGQLAGTYSLSYVSSAATTVGNMLSTQAYNIDLEDQAKVLAYKFYYKAQSGAANCNFSGTSSNSFSVAVYDVTNSVFLGVVGAFSMVQGSGVGIASGTFQTGATTASIRLIVYNANATAGAATLYLDDFTVGPQVTVMAPAMSDWKAITITASAGFGVTTVLAFGRQAGDTLHVRGSFLNGTMTTSPATLTLPYSIDPAKVNSLTQEVGVYQVLAGGGLFSPPASSVGWLAFNSASPNQVFFSTTSTTSGYTPIPSTSTSINIGTTNFEFTVPISGWSSNSVASSDTDTRVTSLLATGSPANVSSGNPVIFPTVTKDTHAAYNAVTGQYITPVSGFYDIKVFINSALFSSGQNFGAYVAGVLACTLGNSVASNQPSLGVGQVYALAGQAITIQCSTGNWQSIASSNLSITKVSGPAVITATETVACSYNNTSGQSIASGTATAVTNWTKENDSHNAMNAVTGVYTIPTSGRYRIFSQLFASASNTGAKFLVSILKGGVVVRTGGINIPGGTTNAVSPVSCNLDSYQFNAGDQISIQYFQNIGIALTLYSADTAGCYWSIVRTGN